MLYAISLEARAVLKTASLTNCTFDSVVFSCYWEITSIAHCIKSLTWLSKSKSGSNSAKIQSRVMGLSQQVMRRPRMSVLSFNVIAYMFFEKRSCTQTLTWFFKSKRRNNSAEILSRVMGLIQRDLVIISGHCVKFQCNSIYIFCTQNFNMIF